MKLKGLIVRSISKLLKSDVSFASCAHALMCIFYIASHASLFIKSSRASSSVYHRVVRGRPVYHIIRYTVHIQIHIHIQCIKLFLSFFSSCFSNSFSFSSCNSCTHDFMFSCSHVSRIVIK